MLTAVIPTHHSRGIARIADALVKYAPPGVEVVARPAPIRKDQRVPAKMMNEEEGDLVIIYCNGMHDRLCALAERCIERGQRYAVVQIALRTTRHPTTHTWRELWRKAAVVWSYYPLDLWIEEDGGAPVDFNFYHAPLGADASVFTNQPPAPRNILVCTSGAQRNQEGVAECDDAAPEGSTIFQLGPKLDKMKSMVAYATNIEDDELAAWYRRCQWVCGLRRQEGFELPAAEGLLCGARPLLYDRPHYRDWFEAWGMFVKEGSREQVAADLRELFRRSPAPITPQERAWAVERFDWRTIIEGFWRRCQ